MEEDYILSDVLNRKSKKLIYKVLLGNQIETLSDEFNYFGIYSWHLLPSTSTFEEIDQYKNILAHKTHQIIEGRDSIDGRDYTIQIDSNPDEKHLKKPSSLETFGRILTEVSFRITPPFYIGQSNDLKRRVSDEWEDIKTILNNSNYIPEHSDAFIKQLADIIKSNYPFPPSQSKFLLRLFLFPVGTVALDVISTEKFFISMLKPLTNTRL